MQIEIKVDASGFECKIAKLLEVMHDTRLIRGSIGETLLRSTTDRIESSGPAPDGTPWAPLSPTYLLLKKNKGNMLRESTDMVNALTYQLTENGVVVGVEPQIKYARIHQKGGVIDMPFITRVQRFRKVGNQVRFAKKKHKRAYDKAVKVGAYKITIPARPYLGVSDEDKEAIKRIVKQRLADIGKYKWEPKQGRGWRASVIFDTNIAAAHSAGRYKHNERHEKHPPLLAIPPREPYKAQARA